MVIIIAQFNFININTFESKIASKNKSVHFLLHLLLIINFTTIFNNNICSWFTITCTLFFHLLYNCHSINNFTKYSMCTIQPVKSYIYSKTKSKNNHTQYKLIKQNKQKVTYQSVTTVVIKNCDPFVFGPAFAIDNKPGFECFNSKFSSGNVRP